MPPEIADSDAESDLGSPLRTMPASQSLRDDQSAQQKTPSVIDFDQFLDPTQRLSSSASHHAYTLEQLDGAGAYDTRSGVNESTPDCRFTSISDRRSTATKAKKRAHSALQENSIEISVESNSKKPKTKRSKTYGARSNSRLEDDENLFAPPTAPPKELENTVPTDPDAGPTHESTFELEPSIAEPDLRSASTSDAIPLMTTSMSSMGQYQSINLDFRGGLDVNANPFGSVSQVSVDGDFNRAGTEAIPSLVRPQPLLEVTNGQPLPAMSQSSPARPLVINPAELTTLPTTDAYDGAELLAEILDQNAETAIPSMEKPPPPKKRGRQTKTTRLTSRSPAPSLGEDADELALSNLPPPTRSRQGTIDSVSHASEVSGPVASTRKRARGKSKVVLEKAESESSPVKMPSSDVGLSDEAIIGLPKEAYKPRPSRSRSKIIVEEEQEPKADPSPAAKGSADTPNFRDKTAADSSEEKSKPQSAISRSKRVGNAVVLELTSPDAQSNNQTPVKSSMIEATTEQTPTVAPTKSNKKKGGKSKVKRAKTSAAALLKKTDPMLSEGEEDVVWMDTKPAPVKLDMPPDLRALKREADPPENDDRDEDGQHEAKQSKITIEIPTNAGAKNPVPEPKKRGRPSKKAQQKSAEKIVDDEEEEPPEQCKSNDGRSALAEKSVNISTPTGKSANSRSTKKTPTVSPLTSPEPEVTEKPNHADPSGDVKEKQQTLTTPSKSKAPAAPSSEKGPTKHSPINPPSATNSGRKTIYRIGLSRRQNIPSLLRKVDREKKPPKNVAIKQKEKKQKVNDDDGEGANENDPGEMRGVDGMLVEWEF